jgi:hypothetical protein
LPSLETGASFPMRVYELEKRFHPIIVTVQKLIRFLFNRGWERVKKFRNKAVLPRQLKPDASKE